MNVEPEKETIEVGLDGTRCNVEFLADFGIIVALQQKLGDALFPWLQRKKIGHGSPFLFESVDRVTALEKTRQSHRECFGCYEVS